MKIVIDTNCVFSAILNPANKIGQIIINGSKYFDFITINQLQLEIQSHTNKILNISSLQLNEFKLVYKSITSKIQFIDDELISEKSLNKAFELTKNIDLDDSPFVSLAIQLKSKLWTGDKKLLYGLKKKGFSQVISTEELFQVYLDKEYYRKKKSKKH